MCTLIVAVDFYVSDWSQRAMLFQTLHLVDPIFPVRLSRVVVVLRDLYEGIGSGVVKGLSV